MEYLALLAEKGGIRGGHQLLVGGALNTFEGVATGPSLGLCWKILGYLSLNWFTEKSRDVRRSNLRRLDDCKQGALGTHQIQNLEREIAVMVRSFQTSV